MVIWKSMTDIVVTTIERGRPLANKDTIGCQLSLYAVRILPELARVRIRQIGHETIMARIGKTKTTGHCSFFNRGQRRRVVCQRLAIDKIRHSLATFESQQAGILGRMCSPFWGVSAGKDLGSARFEILSWSGGSWHTKVSDFSVVASILSILNILSEMFSFAIARCGVLAICT